jgi:hypothetical protein
VSVWLLTEEEGINREWKSLKTSSIETCQRLDFSDWLSFNIHPIEKQTSERRRSDRHTLKINLPQ